MPKSVIFDTDTYEQDLAVVMLDVLEKKNEISHNMYKATKKCITTQEAEHGKSIVGGAAKAVS